MYICTVRSFLFLGSYNYLYIKKNGPYIGPVLLRQGEPGTSRYTSTTIYTMYTHNV